MRLDQMTWMEADEYLSRSSTIILPVGSTEQHGPMGLIGTDTICATAIAESASEICNVIVAPALAYTPAPFNTGFPGTISLSVDVFTDMLGEVLSGLQVQGFTHIYILNGHGANVAPINQVMKAQANGKTKLRSWWDHDAVRQLVGEFYGDWEGMHATPSEIAITQTGYRTVSPGIATEPPQKLSRDFITAHAGDRHGPPDEHRAQFPDGRVGSHSALAKPEHGQRILEAAAKATARDIVDFTNASE